ncbi:chaplin [Streptomyces sp. PSKA30]|uniref:chaplin n=1 Tax=Streptomyces sp. PSKA30 TaxID=2874597 RepID=UPI001CD13FA2|nr:chaplin [Streptomyces sp. PSKA30]MBZ9637945.1 chaplin [Streptomyces sp. PSKA30]
MRQTLSRGVFAAAAATGILSLYGSSALAGTNAAEATEEASGVLSGNSLKVPVKVPLDLCGKTADAVAVLNDSFGNVCGNTSDKKAVKKKAAKASEGTYDTSGGDTTDVYGTQIAKDASGVLSGNSLEVPVEVPVNACGISGEVLAALDQAVGTSCSYGDSGYGTDEVTTPKPSETPTISTPASPAPRAKETPRARQMPPAEVQLGESGELAETGSGALMAASAASAALLAGGVLVYRRTRAASHR